MENNFYSFDPLREHEKKQKSISTIRRHGINVGAAILFLLLAMIALSFVLKIFGLTNLILGNDVFSECFDIAFTILAIFVPFMIVMNASQKYHSDTSFGLEKPKDRRIALWAIPMGLMFCLVGDRIASRISWLFSAFGIELTSNSSSLPTSGVAMFLYFIAVVIVSPLVEEFAMRAVTMQPLRKYGEKFAIVMSAIVFALMHQNMVQGIFAFVAGLVFGYICVVTGSVWCSIAVHCLNNLLSIISMAVSTNTSNGSSVVFYNFLVIAIYVLGVIGTVIILTDKNRPRLQKCEIKSIMTREKVSAFLLAPTMLISIIIMAINSLF